MNEKIVIVIIDSGVYHDHPLFKKDTIEEYMYSADYNSFIAVDRQDSKLFGHGTAIYNIIRECKDFARIVNIKIKDIENGIEENTLIAVLKGVVQTFNPNIINLSLGLNICDNREELYKQCKTITDNGCIIVSAFDNTGSISYPAAFENVVGVVTGYSCSKINDFEYIEDTIVNIAAKGSIQRVAWKQPDYILISGNSFACAHVTVQIAKFILSDKTSSKELILLRFKHISLKTHKIPQFYHANSLCFSINKAALFPFNKEMHSLIRFQNLLNFEIVDVYDSRYSGNVGATTNHLLKSKNKKDFVIKNINDIFWGNFDTLILGHLNELTNLIGKNDLKNYLINQALTYGKNIYSFDEIFDYRSDRIYYPLIDKQSIPPNRFGMLYRISKPVIGIFGTSSKQGKFTLQLKLRELLLKQGYSVGQIGTEPSALLYGMDYVFPMGYNSTVHIAGLDAVIYLNYIINDLCEKGNDIILTGSQSGTIPFDIGNVVHYNFPQYDFLAGTQPDIAVLCVNPYDDVEYISRTIHFIESCADCKVISLVVFPMTINENWSAVFEAKKPLDNNDFFKIKDKLSKMLNITVYSLDNENHINELLNNIIDYLS